MASCYSHRASCLTTCTTTCSPPRPSATAELHAPCLTFSNPMATSRSDLRAVPPPPPSLARIAEMRGPPPDCMNKILYTPEHHRSVERASALDSLVCVSSGSAMGHAAWVQCVFDSTIPRVRRRRRRVSCPCPAACGCGTETAAVCEIDLSAEKIRRLKSSISAQTRCTWSAGGTNYSSVSSLRPYLTRSDSLYSEVYSQDFSKTSTCSTSKPPL